MYKSHYQSDRYTRVEDILGLDNNRLWYYIPGFNGYEISNDGYIRSMKHWKRYPYGILLQPKKNSSLDNPVFELSNNDNRRVTISRAQLTILASKNLHVKGYPRKTYQTDMDSRNKIIMNPKPNKHRKADDTIRFAPSFGIDTKAPIKEKIAPIHFFNEGNV